MPIKPGSAFGRRSHRHVLVLPVLALLMLASLVPILTRNHAVGAASLVGVDASREEEVISLPGLGILLSPGSSLSSEGESGIRLVQGSSLVQAEGRGVLHAGPWFLTGLAGAFYISAHGETVTVAALSTPVLVEGDGGLILVPPGTQWRGGDGSVTPFLEGQADVWFSARKPLPLPEAFVAEQMQRLQRLSPASLLPQARASVPAYPTRGLLQFSAALEAQERQWARETSAWLRSCIERNDLSCVPSLASDTAAQRTFLFHEGEEGMPALLGQARTSPMLLMQFLGLVSEDPTMLLLASVHPDMRAQAWTFPLPQESEQALLRLLLFPQADLLTDAVTPLTRERWLWELQHVLSRHPDGAALLGHVLGEVRDARAQMRALGYVERNMWYGRAAQSLSAGEWEVQPLEEIFSSPPPPQEASSSSPGSGKPAKDPALEEAVNVLLRSAGALFTVETTLEPAGPGLLRVSSVVWSVPDGDHLYGFTYHAQSQTVSGIEKDGTLLPYPMAWDRFAEWVRR